MSRLSILIPVISPIAGASSFIEAFTEFSGRKYTQVDENAKAVQLSPVVFDLFTLGLYNKALAVEQMLRSFVVHQKDNQIEQFIHHPLIKKLGLSTNWLYEIVNKLLNLFVYTNTSWLEKLRLHCNGVVGSVDGDSCQLGFALGLLLPSNPTALATTTGIIATGALEGLVGKIKVKEVGKIPEKLKLALQQKETGKLPQEYYIFFTPVYYWDEVDNQSYKIIDLPEIEQLRAVGIEVRPRETLKEIVIELNLLPIRLAYKQHYFNALLLVLLGSMGNSAYNHTNLNIPLEFQAIKKDFKREPFLVCSKYAGRFIKYYPIEKEGSFHIIPMPAKEISNWYMDLGWSIKMPKETGLNAYFPESWKSYYLSYINIAEKTGLTIYPEENILKAGNILQRRWQLKEPAQQEDGLLTILVSYQPLDLIKLEAELKKIQNDNLSRMRNFLKTQAQGALFFHYSVKLKSSICSFK